MEIIDEINKLCDKYGEDFNWSIVPMDNNFVRELQIETDLSQYSEVTAIARSESSDDVLFLFDNSIYRIYHLTYSKCNAKGFPKYKEFFDTKEVVAYIDKQYICEYL